MQQFARVLTENGVIPVILRGDEHLDLRPIVSDITPDAIASGVLTAVIQPGYRNFVARSDISRRSTACGRSRPPASTTKKHIEEFKMKPPTEPEVFLKAITSLTGPDDPVSRGPNPGTKLDWEVELAIVVDAKRRTSPPPRRPDYIFGYVCLNDISDRATQVDSEGGQHLVRAKSRPWIHADRALPDHWRRRHESRSMDQGERPIRAAGRHQRYAVLDQQDAGLLLRPI